GVDDGGVDDGGIDAGAPIDAGQSEPYTQCGYLACDGGSSCVTITDGPSACLVSCMPATAASCVSGTVCSTDTLYAPIAGGVCVPGCLTDTDCSMMPGT